MKILKILPGNSVPAGERNSKDSYYLFPTLLEGRQYFQEKSIINNMQTRVGIEEIGHKVDFYYNTQRNRIIYLFKTALVLRRIVLETKPDVTHVYWGGISGLILLLLCPGKTIISLLGSDLYGTKYSDNRKFLGFSLLQSFSSKISALIATRTIVMSEKMKQELWNKNSSKIFSIPEGISLNKFCPGSKDDSRLLLNWSRNEFILIFFDDGQVVKNKKLAIKSFELFQNEYPRSEMKLISGFNHEDLIHVYRAADVMLLTSFHEGSNNSLKEALACNLPIISVDCGDASERLTNVENCYICNYDATEIASKIEIVLENGKRSNGHDFVGDFTIEKVASSISDVYKGIV